MKKILLFSLLGLLISALSFGQCGAGYTKASLNWDNLDFLVEDGTYVSKTQAQNQVLAFGTNKLTISHNYSATNTFGETGAHTGETSSNGTGDDVQFNWDGTITLTFQTAVQNVKFSLYDIDYQQKVTVSATNGILPASVTLSTVSGSMLAITPNPLSPNAVANSTAVDNSSTDGTLNVLVAGPVTSVTINISSSAIKNTGNPKEYGDFFLSDISACDNTAAFPTGYFAVSQPFTAQPGYTLTSLDNSVYMVNPANGAAKLIFADPSGKNINSLAYDPYNKIIYYTYSLTSTPSTDKSIQKYSVSSGSISSLVSDVTTLGVVTYTSGVESGGASFYNGSLYLGLESVAGEESKIWKIDFDGSQNPITPAQLVYGVPKTGHEWSDFCISNGVLYDFDGGASNTHNLNHVDLQTGQSNFLYNSSNMNFVPRQASVDWTEKIYNVGVATTGTTGDIAPYAAGNINTTQKYAIKLNGTNLSGSWGDASDAFRPKADFGDAPASFDPVALSPAVHETDPNLRLGATTDIEWTKAATPGTNADQDGGDEDGLPYVSLLNQNGGKYFTEVDVYNNTGANATLAGWVDFNNNGVFDASEGIVKTVGSLSTVQRIGLLWTGISTSVVNYQNVYLRIRLTSTSNNMTTSSATGYFSNGEVEDYKVMVTPTPLPLDIVSFTANKTPNEKVTVQWTAVDEEPGTQYQLESSDDARNWNILFSKTITTNSLREDHTYIDENPHQPKTYYRLRFTSNTNKIAYTTVRSVEWESVQALKVRPNPVTAATILELYALKEGQATITLYSMQGASIFSKSINVQKGINNLPVGKMFFLKTGIYSLQITVDGKTVSQKLVVL